MARTKKKGLDYFPHDTDLFEDTKIKYIRALHGMVGYSIYVRLLEMIYKESGYYLVFRDKELLLFAKDCNIEYDLCKNIVNLLIEESLFDKKLYLQYFILTSCRIQINYITACERRKRIDIEEKYLLIEPNHPNNFFSESIISKIYIIPINVNINCHNDDIGTQNKNENINNNEMDNEMENGTEKNPSQTLGPSVFQFSIPDLLEIQDEIKNHNLIPNSKRIPEINIEAFAKHYYDKRMQYQDDNGFWLTSKGQPIDNWKSNLYEFIQNENFYTRKDINNGISKNTKERPKAPTGEELLQSAVEFVEHLKNR